MPSADPHPVTSPDNAPLVARLRQRAEQLVEREPSLHQATSSPADRSFIAAHSTASIEYLASACARFAHHPCLGTRNGDAPYTTLTHGEVWQRICDLAAAWRRTDNVRTGDRVGILGFASPDWVLADFACLYLAAVSVPLRVSVGDDELAFMINDAALRCILCSAEQLRALGPVLEACPTVERIIVMDAKHIPDVPLPARIEVEILHHVLELGAQSPPVPYVIPGVGTEEADPLLTIVYTSGSTGRSKGALFPESIWRHTFRGGFFDVLPHLPNVALGFMPLNHIAGRGSLLHTLMSGGVTYFVQKSDLSTLFDDIRAARPTSVFLVPRISDTIYQTFKWRCAQMGSVGDLAIQEKVMAQMRHTYLGDRLLAITLGTAPTAPEVIKFLRACFEVPVFNGYGATENGVVTFEDHIVRSVVTDYKLVDVPELGYFVTDKPYPRGELRVKSPRIIPGYLNRPDATATLLDEDGYMKTGDIVEERGPDHVVWIDRKANVIKLAQGEFVGVSRLEGLFVAHSALIKQIYLYGNSARAYLLAVVVPNTDDAIPRTALRQALRTEFERIGQTLGLHGYEIPRDFIVSHTGFSKDNGLLTESEKPARQKLKARYGDALEALYVAIEENASRGLQALQAEGLTVEERVRRAVAMTLGVPLENVTNTEHSFIQSGGDSLSAVRLSDLLQQVCGVAPPVGMVLDPRTSVAQIATYITDAKAREGDTLTCEKAHGHRSGLLTRDEIQLTCFLPDAEALAAAAQPAVSDAPRHVLLTGATGFLGRFLVLELLQHLKERQGTLTCLVRADDDDEAWQRLRREFTKDGEAFLKHFDNLTDALHVVAGDLIQPGFGLKPGRYTQMCSHIDTVLHNGALVNHALSYAQLFEPNVLGTVEIMRFALTTRRKRISFMSTVAVPAGARLKGVITEAETGVDLWSQRPMEGDYAAGYGTSKWAGEVLLQELSERFHIPVQVFRSSMIMAHTRLLGQVNPTDFVTRLLHGIIHTGLAPESFGHGAQEQVHFDGSPVDFVAGSIAAITCEPAEGYQTYHVINPHTTDGIGLDRIVNWVASAGYPIERVADYDAWFTRFRDRLKGLDDTERTRSPWPILYRWETPTEDVGGALLDARLFRDAVARCTPWSDVPHLSESYVHQIVASMAALGLVPGPSMARQLAHERAHPDAPSLIAH